MLGLLFALSLRYAPRALANGDPKLDWWTIETEHARVHYDRSLEPVANRVARAVEQVHSTLSGALGYSPTSLTEIVLTDDTDSANGSATAVPYNTIRLYVTAPGDVTALSDYDDWYLGLVTHEYTHILHTDDVSVPECDAYSFNLMIRLAPSRSSFPRWE